MDPKRLAARIVAVNCITMVSNLVILYALGYNLRDYARRLVSAETKRQDSEKQKIFVLSFSHELRNLLNNMLGNL